MACSVHAATVRNAQPNQFAMRVAAVQHARVNQPARRETLDPQRVVEMDSDRWKASQSMPPFGKTALRKPNQATG